MNDPKNNPDSAAAKPNDRAVQRPLPDAAADSEQARRLTQQTGKQTIKPGLYVVATPIGNLRDVTLRALDVLAAADLVLAEDTRVTRKLLSAYGIGARLEAYHAHNAASSGAPALEALAAGQIVALVSDAGTPLVSDPGESLVRDAVEAGHRVVPVPGASALLAGLAGAGLPAARFLFAGFLPPKQGARRETLEELADIPATLVFFETGPRLAESLADMAAILGDRPAAIGRELTKLFEEFRRNGLAALAAAVASEEQLRGEIVVLVGPPAPREGLSDAAIAAGEADAALRAALATLPTRQAAQRVAAETGATRRALYRRALQLKDA